MNGRSKLAAAMAVLWLCVALGTWTYLLTRGLNHFFSAVVMTGGAWMFALLFDQKWPALKDGLVRFGFASAWVHAFFLAALFSGDWGDADHIKFTCINDFHLHHWFKSMVGGVLVMLIPGCTATPKYRVWTLGVPCLVTGLWTIAVLSANEVLIEKNRGLIWEFAVAGMLFLLTSIMVRIYCGRPSRWFHLHVAIMAGVELGIFANGLLGIGRDFNQKTEGLAPSFIFFKDASCR